MSQCSINDLLNDGRCLAAIDPGLLNPIIVQLWCDALAAIAVEVDDNVAIQNVDDLLWYRLAVVLPDPNVPMLWLEQTPTDPGVNPYLVLVNTDDGLKYKLSAFGAAPAIRWQVDPTPTGEAETPTTVIRGAVTYAVSLVNPGPVPILTAISNTPIQAEDGQDILDEMGDPIEAE